MKAWYDYAKSVRESEYSEACRLRVAKYERWRKIECDEIVLRTIDLYEREGWDLEFDALFDKRMESLRG